MIFLSYWFIILAAIAIPLYWIFSRSPLRLIILLISSFVLYSHFAGPTGILPILILGLVTYGCGYSRNKMLCGLGIALCVASLVFYKYTQFLAESLLEWLLAADVKKQALEGLSPYLPDAAPLAISFFVFEFVHYLYDVWRGNEPVKHPLYFALFAMFWPSIVAGPIKRYEDFVPQLQEPANQISLHDIVQGGLRVAAGLIKKIAADNITIYLNYWMDQFAEVNLGWRWLFLGLMALRIYWDFSGYSDMAIGYAQMMGFRLPENFNFPYSAISLTDFWRRWHISLSTWIRDYIYIPLGGSRHGVARKIGNGMIAFGLCGLWHGAGWNFLLWGLYHGLGLAVSSNYKVLLGRVGEGIHDGLSRVPAIAWGMTLLYVCMGWLLFFYPLPEVWKMTQLLFPIT